jgi:hypothetical protein
VRKLWARRLQRSVSSSDSAPPEGAAWVPIACMVLSSSHVREYKHRQEIDWRRDYKLKAGLEEGTYECLRVEGIAAYSMLCLQDKA